MEVKVVAKQVPFTLGGVYQNAVSGSYRMLVKLPYGYDNRWYLIDLKTGEAAKTWTSETDAKNGIQREFVLVENAKLSVEA